MLVTYHPSAVLRVPKRSREVELYEALVRDLRVAAELGQTGEG